MDTNEQTTHIEMPETAMPTVAGSDGMTAGNNGLGVNVDSPAPDEEQPPFVLEPEKPETKRGRRSSYRPSDYNPPRRDYTEKLRDEAVGGSSAQQETATQTRHHRDLEWQLFRTFFKIGIVTFGGGYAMIPMIEAEVVDKKKWIDKETFLDLIAIAQTCPGVFAINISTFIGYKLRNTLGAVLSAFGAALPSFVIILLIAMFFLEFQHLPWVEACFRGIRPAVVALIAVPTFNLARSAKINLHTCWIPILCALLIYLLGVNPVLIIIGAALGGYLYGTLIKDKD